MNSRQTRNRLRRLTTATGWASLAAALLIVAFATWYYEPDPGEDAPRVLVSIDKTLWNRIGFNRWTYIRALRRAGMRPVLIDFDNRPASNDASNWLKGFDGLMLSGGGDVGAIHYGGNPDVTRDVSALRDEFELALLAVAEREGIPVLGICRGHQLLNVYRGGTLGDFRHDSERYRRHKRIWRGHAIDIEPGSRLHAIYNTRHLPDIVTWHGQYIDRLGAGLRVTAYAPDGTPEAIELVSDEPFGMVGVQWHAEVLPWDPKQAALFEAFYSAAERYNESRVRQ